jgi:hypothetical protein
MTPEEKARVGIDVLLQQAGWHVCDMAQANIHAARGVALRQFPLKTGFGFADYPLYIDGKAAGVIEAKREGRTLTGVEIQSARYAQGLPCQPGAGPCRAAQKTEIRRSKREKKTWNLLNYAAYKTSSGTLRMTFCVTFTPVASTATLFFQ